MSRGQLEIARFVIGSLLVATVRGCSSLGSFFVGRFVCGRLGLFAIAVAVLSGCGMKPEEYYQKMRPNLLKGNYAAANEFLEKNKEEVYSKDNRLLFYMDKGMVLSLGKKYTESNAELEKAKTAAEDLWTESVGKNALAFVTTDNSLPYQGEDFEKVAIHFIAAMNYMGLGDYDGARVEARQVSQRLQLYNNKYAEEDGATMYKDDAFAHWMAGKLAEAEGGQEALNDAWIDYKKSLAIYETDYAQRYATAAPTMLVEDSLRVLEALGPDFRDELQKLKARHGNAHYLKQRDTRELGEVVLIHMNGEAPYKIDKFWDAQVATEWIRVAYPEFVAKPHRITKTRMVPSEGASVDTEMGQNVTAIAIQNLNDHMGRIKAKAIARAVAKYAAGTAGQVAGAQISKKNEGAGTALFLASTIFKVASAATESADKRSWITLPSSIWIGRTYLPPGPQKVTLKFLDAAGNEVQHDEVAVDVKPGQANFVTYRTYE